MNKLIIISGPTAVGKTDIIQTLSNKYKTIFEVINADMGQLYGPISIGTAKPDISKELLPHHLFGIIDAPENFTIVNYRKEIEKKALELWENGKIPVIVGGSGFYIKSLFFETENLDQIIDNNLDQINQSNQDLWNRLNEIDSSRASQININDRYRLQRALTLWNNYKIKPSQLIPKFKLISSCSEVLFIYLNRDKLQLSNRIHERICQMLDSGWLDEVKKLDENWLKFLKQKKLIGYDDVIKYINNEINAKEELISIIKSKTLAYVKKQLTFWRYLKNILEKNKIKNIFEINLSEDYKIEPILKEFVGF